MPRKGGSLVVMGIDPSLTSTGYALVEFFDNQFKALDFGVINTKSNQSLAARLALIFNTILNQIDRHNPHEIAVEDVFYAKNPKIAIKMGHARGASLVAAAIKNLPVGEYSAREIKMAVSGYGNASKEQVKRMVLSQLDLKTSSIGYDVSDAFAVAICHCSRVKLKQIKGIIL